MYECISKYVVILACLLNTLGTKQDISTTFDQNTITYKT